MGARSVVVGVLLAAALSGCDPEPAGPGGAAPARTGDSRVRLEKMAGEAPAELLARVRAAYESTGLRAVVTRGAGEEETTFTFLADAEAWRVDSAAEGDEATVLAVGDTLCFDTEFRPRLSALVAESYGVVDFDPQPWSCTPEEFGLNPMVTFDLRREDPRWRLEHLTADPAAFRAEVEEVDGRPLLHLRTSGVTRDGPLDIARPRYDLWIDEAHRPVLLETEGLRWAFDDAADLDERLAAPAPHDRGSYGFLVGPGQGLAKACHQGGQRTGLCAWRGSEASLTWGDGRAS